MTDKITKHVTIIGTGIVGICSALSLLDRGYNVTLIDRDPPASGASHGNAGVISPWSCIPQSMPGLWRQVPHWLLDSKGPVAVRAGHALKFLPWALRFFQSGHPTRVSAISDAMNALNRPNLSMYRKLLEGTGQESLVVDSWYLHVYRDAGDVNPSSLASRIRKEKNVPFEIIYGDEIRDFEPALSPAIKAALVMREQGRALDPGAVGKALFHKALSRGATYEQCAVKGIEPHDRHQWTLQTSDGPRHASCLLLAAGAWSASLLRPLDIRVPLEAERGYHLVLKDPGITLRHSIMDVDRKFVASSMHAGVRCAGTAEFSGLDAPPDYRRARVFNELAKDLFPEINVDDGVEWMGTRPSFPDSLPAIGPVPGFDSLFVAFGHSHFGFGMAPNTGNTIAGIVAGEKPVINLGPFRIDRFKEK